MAGWLKPIIILTGVLLILLGILFLLLPVLPGILLILAGSSFLSPGLRKKLRCLRDRMIYKKIGGR